MQPNLSRLMKQFFHLCMLSIMLLSIVTLSGCTSKDSKYPVCVKLTNAQIENWAKKGYTKEGYSIRVRAALGLPGSTYKVYAEIVKNDSIIEGSLTQLTNVDTCSKNHINLSDYIFSGMIPLKFSDLVILTPEMTVKDDFMNIQFTPYTYIPPDSSYELLAMAISKHTKDKPKYNYTGKIGLPCPPCPNCPSPCPPPTICALFTQSQMLKKDSIQ